MSKGLEALENLVFERGTLLEQSNNLEIVKKELKDKEKFEEIVNMDLDLFMKAVDIKGLIEDYQKFKKALEIIKSTNLNVACYGYIDGKNVYTLRIGELEIKYISQEQYDLLKEVIL